MRLSKKCRVFSLALTIVWGTVGLAQKNPAPTMTLVVNETQAARRLVSVREEIKTQPGTLDLAYPSWIPGEHGPTGPIQQTAALRVQANGLDLVWTRDPENIFVVHVQVPQHVEQVSVTFDTLLENTISDHQLLLAWNTVVFYPRNIDKKDLMIAPSVILPAGWKQGSSLKVTGESAGRVDFAPVSLERLIDSPVLAGEFYRSVKLTSTWPAVLDITGDSQSAVDKADDAHAFDVFSRLVDEDRAMFGFRHWDTFHILVSQSDADPFDGLEHEDSPYNGIGDSGLSKKDQLAKFGWPLLAHEQSHSWCGKYRRPAELYSKPDYQGPEKTTLLWVYEGLNEYIGWLLATRSGFNDDAYMRDYLARTSAHLGHEPSRASVPLVDTATENWVLRHVPGGWSALRRSQDYYDEGGLTWLHADVIIREKTHGKASLDDFLRDFLGQRDTGPIVNPYTREDVEAALSAICPYDWHGFFEKWIYRPNPNPPTSGLEAAGWRLTFTDEPNNEPFNALGNAKHNYEAWYSIGLGTKSDGDVTDVFPGTPAFEAGLAPQMTILAVNGRVFTTDGLNDAIAHPKDGKITLIVKNFDSVETRELRYAGGLKYPHLERIPDSHDYLSEILKTKTGK
jgi:predicted metalloprotease with PDZ domain